MVLRSHEWQRRLAVAQREERSLLALHEFLDHDFRTRLAEAAAEHHVDGRQRLVARHRHDDALPRRKPFGLHHDRRALRADVVLRRIGVSKMRIGRGRNAVVAAQRLGETLRRLQLPRRLARPERGDTRRRQIVYDAGGDRRVGSDDHKCHAHQPAERDHGRVVHDVERDACRIARDAGVAGGTKEFRRQRRSGDLPRQRVFAPARAEKKDFHGRVCASWISGRGLACLSDPASAAQARDGALGGMAMISCSAATCRANAPRPAAVAATIVCGRLLTKDFSTVA